MTFFKDALKVILRWPLYPFFIHFLTSYFICLGQLALNEWRLVNTFSSYVGATGLCLDSEDFFDMKFSSGYNCFVYLLTNGGLGHLKPQAHLRVGNNVSSL